MAEGERPFKRLLVEKANLQPGERVLDLGCGTGTLALAAKRVQPAASVTGLDADPEILARARAKAAGENAEIAFVKGVATELPFADASFDAVCSTLLFHHLGPDEKPTRDNAAGTLPSIFSRAGFGEVQQRERLRTGFGSLAFYGGVRVRR